MAADSWLPIGFSLPDGATCGRILHSSNNWQIIETRGAGYALIARPELVEKWIASGLAEMGDLCEFVFGVEVFHEISCGCSQLIAPLTDCRSPQDKSEALAFATALRDTRSIDPESPLQNSIYIESLSRLLPTYGITSRTDDDIVLGYWLTGGARVSVKSFRRLRQMLSWLPPSHLSQVIQTAGFDVVDLNQLPPTSTVSSDIKEQVREQEGGSPCNNEGRFELPGRQDLEEFFNEHVIDIIRNKERYKAFGINTPPAVVLHGPPGCGKTFAVEQLIEYLAWPSFQIDASSVASPYIHETSRKVAEVFSRAIQNAPSVLVIDEMEAFLAHRETVGEGHHRLEEIAEFLRRIPEASKNEVLVIAMTNRIEMIDPAVIRRGRFDHIIEVGFASVENIQTLLTKLFAALPRDESVNPIPLASILAGRPLSDVAFVVREGARLAARSGCEKLRQDHLMAALENALARNERGSPRRIGFL